MSYIKRAKNEGGKVLTGGSSLKFSGIHKNGWYIAPTVIEDVKINSKINHSFPEFTWQNLHQQLRASFP